MRVSALGVSGVVDFGRRVIRSFIQHRMSTYAAALAYRGLFGLFPFVLILVVLASMLGSPGSFSKLVEEARSSSSQDVPRQIQPVVEQGREQVQPLEEMIEEAEKQAGGALLLFSVAVAMWSVSALASTLAEAFNAAYGAPEARRGWKQSALALISGPLIALSLILSMTLMLTAPRVAEGAAEVFGLRELFVLLWGWVRYPVALVLLWAVLSIVYRFGSAVEQRFRTVALGAALAVIAWAVVSVGFSVYLANFADYGATYGSLGAAVGLLFYFNVSASIVLAGAEVNAAIHYSVADMATQTEKQDVERGTSTVRDGKIKDA